jgi:hypothetical protein
METEVDVKPSGARNTLLSGGCLEHPAIRFASEVDCAKTVR